jgi:hypothetical protein
MLSVFDMGRPFWKGGSRAGEPPFLSAAAQVRRVLISLFKGQLLWLGGEPIAQIGQSVAAWIDEIKFPSSQKA